MKWLNKENNHIDNVIQYAIEGGHYLNMTDEEIAQEILIFLNERRGDVI